MSNIAISIKNVSKYYKLYNSPKDRLKEALSLKGKQYHKKFYATKNLDLEIKKGEIIGIVGKNGSGKSTLLKLITGVLTPDEGSIQINGNISALLELGSGFNPEFTGIQNIFFYGTILGFSKKEMEEKLDEILTFADIGEFINQPLKTYSSGMKSRLGFAVAVHIEPEILILDEVLAVGDELFKRKCYAKMEEFFKGGKTILYVSHDANSVNQLCTRAILLNNGKILMDDEAQVVTKYYQKLIFSKEDKKESILNEIKEKTTETIPTKTIDNTKSNTHIQSSETTEESYFIPDFLPKSTLEYKNYDIEIKDTKIIDIDNNQVNVLKYGEHYSFSVKIKSKISAKNVSFGLQLKDDKGFVLTSVESLRCNKKNIKFNLNENDIFDLKFNFINYFNNGTYYFNLGISSFEKEQVILNRVIDILVFKSTHSKSLSGGYIDLFESLDVKIDNKDFLYKLKEI